MEITELAAPSPRGILRPHEDFDYGIAGAVDCPKVTRRVLPRLDRVLSARRSRREFPVRLSLQDAGDLLWHSVRVREAQRSGLRRIWESRPVPSGGGCHPTRIVLINHHLGINALLIYDEQHHMLGVHRVQDRARMQRCVDEVDRCLKVGKGTVFWFIADLAQTGAKYSNPESLVWRDSGALLATIGLVAEALSLNFCALGLHDIRAARQILHLPRHIIGVGGCIISRRTPVSFQALRRKARRIRRRGSWDGRRPVRELAG